MTYFEDDPIMISALQHYVFFEWEGALILNERVWDRKFQTAEDRLLYERAHEQDRESRGDVRIDLRNLPDLGC